MVAKECAAVPHDLAGDLNHREACIAGAIGKLGGTREEPRLGDRHAALCHGRVGGGWIHTFEDEPGEIGGMQPEVLALRLAARLESSSE